MAVAVGRLIPFVRSPSPGDHFSDFLSAPTWVDVVSLAAGAASNTSGGNLTACLNGGTVGSLRLPDWVEPCSLESLHPHNTSQWRNQPRRAVADNCA